MRSFVRFLAGRPPRVLAISVFLTAATSSVLGFAQAPPGPQGVAPGFQPNANPTPTSPTFTPPRPPTTTLPGRTGLQPTRPGQTSNLPGTGTSGGGAPGPGRRPGPNAPPVPPPRDVPPAPPTELTTVAPGGLTAQQVGQRAVATSYQAKAADALAASASAKADQQWAGYLPRLGLTARYTRLSKFTPPVIDSGQTVVTDAPEGTVNPTPTFSVGQTRFPLVLDQYLLQATIAVPVSDYFLRIGKAYSAALQAADAAQYDTVAARAKSFADGEIAYFTWLRAKGAAVVADESLAVARAHLKDSEAQFQAGNAFRVDVLRAQTQAAAAELGVQRAQSGVVQTDRQLRVAIHATEEEVLLPGESLDTKLPPVSANLKALIAEANAQRPELKSINRNVDASRSLTAVARAGRIPVVSAFGDVTYANPNPRVFPQSSVFFPTWSLGAQLTWSPSDVLVANATGSDAAARAAAFEAQKIVIQDSIELEVTLAYQAIVEADAAIGTTERQLESAAEGYRVTRELFLAGRGTATTLVDAEVVLAQSRFERLNALVDARLGRIRLDYALGRESTKVAAR